MPSRRHQALVHAVPRVRRARELEAEEVERHRIVRWHAELDRGLPTSLVPGFARRYTVERLDLGFASYVVTPRRARITRTLYYVHGGGFIAPIDPFHVRYALRLARRIGARVVLPDYPLAPEHSWRESHDTLVDDVTRWAERPGGAVLAGDSSGGNIALAVAQSMRDRELPAASHLVLHAPWVDLSMSSPDTPRFAERDPWLFPGKAQAYAAWWAGGDDLTRPEVSPVFGELAGLPTSLLLYGTLDLLAPGCRMLAARGAAAGWPLTVVEEPDLLHSYGLLPFIPEARRALAQVVGFLR